jgi:cystathionine beta-lyase/cystathionine gamma-synthase
MASGLCANIVLLRALVPAGGHLITTTDCYITTRIFIETVLPNMGITVYDFTDLLVWILLCCMALETVLYVLVFL